MTQEIRDLLTRIYEETVPLEKVWIPSSVTVIQSLIGEAVEKLDKMQPSGWKLVPLKPTEEMISAGFNIHPCQPGENKVTDCYVAMIKIAPEATNASSE